MGVEAMDKVSRELVVRHIISESPGFVGEVRLKMQIAAERKTDQKEPEF